jgi:hypothetical protein
MNAVLKIPEQLRIAKMPRGETNVRPSDMSAKNRAIWEQRCRERAERERLDVAGLLRHDAPDSLPPRPRRCSGPGSNAAKVLALLSDGKAWQPAKIADALGMALSSVYSALASLKYCQQARRLDGEMAMKGMKAAAWRKVGAA